MDRELATKILSDEKVQGLLLGGRVEPKYACVRLCAIIKAFEDLTVSESIGVREIVIASIPSVFVREVSSFSKNSGVAIVSRLIDHANQIMGAMELASQEHERIVAEEAEAKAQAIEEARREQAQIELDAIKAQEEVEERTRKIKEEAEAREREEVAARAREESAKAAADRKAREEALKASQEKDASNIETEPTSAGEGVLTAQQFNEMPIEKSGLPGGIVNTLAKSQIKTVGQLVLFGSSRSYTDIRDIGEKSASVIEQIVKGLHERVKS